MEEDRFCKRCSVNRVNIFCRAYQEAHQGGDQRTLARLKDIVKLVEARGYQGASGLLAPGLGERALRALCFNVSSFVRDEDVEVVMGVTISRK